MKRVIYIHHNIGGEKSMCGSTSKTYTRVLRAVTCPKCLKLGTQGPKILRDLLRFR